MQTEPRPPIVQVSCGCPKCGSFYRRGSYCNACGAHAPEPETRDEKRLRVFTRAGRAPTGRVWDSFRHMYVKQGGG